MADLSYIYKKTNSISGKIYLLNEVLNKLNDDEEDIMKPKYQKDLDSIIAQKSELENKQKSLISLEETVIANKVINEEEIDSLIEYYDDELSDYTVTNALNPNNVEKVINIIKSNFDYDDTDIFSLYNIIICAYAKSPYFFKARKYVEKTKEMINTIDIDDDILKMFEEVPSFYVRCHDSKNACINYYKLADLYLQKGDIGTSKDYIVLCYKEMAYLSSKFYLPDEKLTIYHNYLEEIEDAKNFVPYDKRNKVEQTEEYQKVFDEAMTELLSLNPNINEYDRFKKQCFEKRGIIFEK